jgi:hypothetical protein
MKESLHREMLTIEAMIRIYCRSNHGKDLCEECGKLLTYAIARIEKCRFGPGKPACNNCKVHCYSPRMREKIKNIMRFSGPKMIYKHPVLALFHIIREKKINHSIHQQINY